RRGPCQARAHRQLRACRPQRRAAAGPPVSRIGRGGAARQSDGSEAGATRVHRRHGFNPEWVVDRIAPRPILFITTDDDRLVPLQESEAMYARAGEPKKLVVLKGFGHYEVYGGDAFRQVMEETLAWYGTHLPAR